MSYRGVIEDKSPVPSDVGTSIDEALPPRTDLQIIDLLFAIIDRLDGILYHFSREYVAEDETEH